MSSRFHKGDCVVATREAGRTGLATAGERAVVVTESTDPAFVTVVRAGLRTGERWASDFWRKPTQKKQADDR
jgi:hypothetical protein